MDFNIVTFNEVCYQTIQDNADFLRLIYYSHIPTAIIALWMSFFIFFKSGKLLSSRLLLTVSILFSLWSLMDLITWTSYDTKLTMFTWATLGLLFILIFSVSLYFTYVFFDKKDISLKMKVLLFSPIFPVLLLTPTVLNLSGFNNESCEAIEGVLFTSYYHLFGAFVILWILALAIKRYRRAIEFHEKTQIALFALGIELFLTSFFVAGYVASLFDSFEIGIYGLFGMPIFMAFLGYLIVKFKAFDIKLIGTQALVIVLIILTGSQFFYVKTHTNFILTIITFILVVLSGFFLIQSFKRSEERKAELQLMADRLAISNDRLREIDNTKTEFISIASHQLRTPLTSIKGYCALILEGAYGKLTLPLQEIINRIIFSNERLINLVENLLNISRMEAGRMEYDFQLHHIETVLNELYATFSFAAQTKHLAFTISLPENPLPLIRIDKQKIQEVFSNLIDNAIKYTSEGSVTIIVDRNPDTRRTRITIKDSGIGIPKSELPYLFVKFSRGKDINRLHANGTGLGLYVAKNIIEAHKGKIYIESEGAGQGTSFVVELG